MSVGVTVPWLSSNAVEEKKEERREVSVLLCPAEETIHWCLTSGGAIMASVTLLLFFREGMRVYTLDWRTGIEFP